MRRCSDNLATRAHGSALPTKTRDASGTPRERASGRRTACEHKPSYNTFAVPTRTSHFRRGISDTEDTEQGTAKATRCTTASYRLAHCSHLRSRASAPRIGVRRDADSCEGSTQSGAAERNRVQAIYRYVRREMVPRRRRRGGFVRAEQTGYYGVLGGFRRSHCGVQKVQS